MATGASTRWADAEFGPVAESCDGSAMKRMRANYVRAVNSDRIYVHYAKAPIRGEWVIPWNELCEELRALAGHEGRVHADRFPEQWHPDRVYIHELPPGMSVLNIGTTYSGEGCWSYQVEPDPPLERDPERGGHLATSRICPRAQVVGRLHPPINSQEEEG